MISEMSEKSIVPLPQPTAWDHAHVAAKAALSALPVVGGQLRSVEAGRV